MTKGRLMTLPVLMLTALLGTGVAAANGDGMTTAYVVHGIDGDDFPALNLDPDLPVDVFVSGLDCAIKEFKFGDRVGPLVVPAGSYDVTVSLADTDNPCDGTPVIVLEGVPLAEGANSTIIAQRTYDGSPGAGDQLGLGITLVLADNDFSSTGRGKSRVIVQHAANAPSVDVIVSRDYYDMSAPGVTVPGFTNATAPGDAVLSQINAEFRPGDWDVALEVEGSLEFGPDILTLKPYTTTYIYAVGDFSGGTFQYLVYTEGGLKKMRDRGNSASSVSRRGR